MPASDDARYMAAAIRYSRRHLGMTGDNPSVGALIVADGVIVGRGVTSTGGRPHAERIALAEAGDRARGATAYVTLEPCSNFGRSPPCANALVEAGVRRVVVAVEDPDPRVSGRGVRQLREAGIEVETGCLAAEAEREMEGFLSLKRRGRPFLTLKLAVSPDGFIGRPGESNAPVTGSLARSAVHAARGSHEAVMVGIGTVLADDPRLNVRLPGRNGGPVTRIVIDPQARTPPSAKIMADIAADPVAVIVTAAAPRGSVGRLKRAGVKVLLADADYRGNIRPHEILRLAGLIGLKSVFLEGGAETARRFLEAGLVDRILLFKGAVALGQEGIASPVDEHHLPDGYRLAATATYGTDRLLEYERA